MFIGFPSEKKPIYIELLITAVFMIFWDLKKITVNTSHLEANAVFFGLLMGIFDPYVQKVDFLISNAR